MIVMLGNTSLEINNNIVMRFKLNTFETNIWKILQDFFTQRPNWNILLKFLNYDSKYSLRVIDYFLTSYCYNNNIKYNNINMSFSYKEQLKKFHKKFFDPCSRGQRIPFFFTKTECIITTICQLNFFKWFIERKIYEYFIFNFTKIKKSMKNKNTNINTLDYSSDKVIYCSTSKNIRAIFD